MSEKRRAIVEYSLDELYRALVDGKWLPAGSRVVDINIIRDSEFHTATKSDPILQVKVDDTDCPIVADGARIPIMHVHWDEEIGDVVLWMGREP